MGCFLELLCSPNPINRSKRRLILNAWRIKFRKIPRYLYESRKILLLIVIVVVITLTFSALIAVWLVKSYDLNVHNVGAIRLTGVEVYGGNITSINGIPSIDWGTIQFGETRNASFFLRSTSNVPTKLAFNVTEWSPKGIETYLTLSWNYNGTYIQPNQEIPVTLKLNASDTIDFAKYLTSNDITSYSFTLNVSPIQ